jgi:hypothetical protein
MWTYRNLLRESTAVTPNDDVRRFDPFSAHGHLQTTTSFLGAQDL